MENFSHAATILPARDMSKSIDFYTKKLGFNLEFSWEDPVSYAVLRRGEVNIHLSLMDKNADSKTFRSLIYIFVHDIESIYEECLKKGVVVETPLASRDYKMKDFDISDPDGHQITFGCGDS
ncbi:VOC family protein [Algoriphagus sediminis]|uniref:VOC family protein n=1 Tax=Algoriphagus sediminis TaxID=3057113 RepID=A0ABT7YB69_9BACT|nr:VOC family protein [Algoriphagus sediminis]MDN3203763.1 VOC family protein [Algoriphagus sediminis]